MSKITNFSELTLDELNARKREFKQEILNMRLQQQSGQLKKPSMLRDLSRDIARIETVLTHKRLGSNVNYRKPSKGAKS